MHPIYRTLICFGAILIGACSDDGTAVGLRASPDGSGEGSGSGSSSGSGEGSGDAPCWVASGSGLCPAQPIGSSPSDCPSGRIFEGSGFAPGTGPCQPHLPDWNCPPGWTAVPALTDGSGAENPPEGLPQFNRCEPPPLPADCPAGTFARVGSATCQPLGTACPSSADRWPDEATLRALAPAFTGPIVYVAADAAADGAGTRQSPRPLVAAAIRAAQTGLVALALGTYNTPVRLDRSVALVGACVAGTTLSSDQPSDGVGVVDISAGAPALLANLSITGERPGLTIATGSESPHTLAALAIVGVRTVGVLVNGAQAVTLAKLRIEGTRAAEARTFGRAIALTDGATVEATDLSLLGNRDIALSLDGTGTAITAIRLLVGATAERLTDGLFGRAIDLRGGASVALREAALLGNREVAIAAAGTATTLTAEDLFVSSTRARARDSAAGRGLELTDGATATLARATFADHLALALSIDGAGTSATLQQVVVRNTRGALATLANGYGASITGGAALQASSTLITGSHSAGLLASGLRTRLTLADCLVDSTEPDSDGAGNGIAVESGAIADLRRTLLTANTEAALFATGRGSRVEVADLAATNTRSNPSDGRAGLGLWLQDSAAFVGDRLLLRGNRFAGLYATGAGTEARATQLVVAGTLPQSGDGRGGMGLFITEGATADINAAALLSNHELGLLVTEASTTVTLRDALVADTLPRTSGLHGGGAEVQTGAILRLERALLQRNRGVGLLVTDARSRLTFVALTIEATRPRAEPLGGFGTGLALTGGGAAVGSDLTLTGNALCGLQLAGDTLSLDVDRATISGNAVGIAIQGPGFGLTELRSSLRDEQFESNGTDISSEQLELPEPVLDLR
jgi:hypothetical protein